MSDLIPPDVAARNLARLYEVAEKALSGPVVTDEAKEVAEAASASEAGAGDDPVNGLRQAP